MDFAIQADHDENESKRKDKFLDFVWEMKKLWNIKVTERLFAVGLQRSSRS